MAKHVIKTKNCSSGLWWITRPVNKMNGTLINELLRGKKFVKRYSMKKQRKYLKEIDEMP